MCFTAYRKPELKQATQDILVYKVISKDGWGWAHNLLIDGKECKWEQGWQYTETHFVKDALYYVGRWVIDKNAFHSKKTHEGADFLCAPYEMIVEMYIPKGAYYYENETEYVSSDLVWY